MKPSVLAGGLWLGLTIAHAGAVPIGATSRPGTTVEQPQFAAEEVVAELSRLRFHSSFWMNLHHTLCRTVVEENWDRT